MIVWLIEMIILNVKITDHNYLLDAGFILIKIH